MALNFAKNLRKKDIILKKKHTAIRMCVICKQRFSQNELYRFWLKDKKIVLNLHFGRSFYLCEICLHKEDKKSLQKPCFKAQDIKITLQDLKEIQNNGKD
ncbi:DUF448 domain-containing protein [Campylobacter sp. MIT 12-5580]|uniref:DUF448 domain-containing protein n=1 Tax=Campylobacter sp. MIT 12-5580 TaxID=2040651 RepID=UPI0020172105|nr:DUF448 domain-containing protein [Campylobacter sp. MIT 12-5580]